MSRNAKILVWTVVAILVVGFTIQYVYNPLPELNLIPGYKPGAQ